MKFKQIKDFPNYEVSENGDVQNIKTGKLLKSHLTKQGVLAISLRKDNILSLNLIHRLVAITYIENPFNLEFVIHIDNNKTNNNVNNLQWKSQLSFVKNQYSTGILNSKGDNNFNSRLDNNDVKTIKHLLSKKIAVKKIAELFNVSNGIIYCIKNGDTWKHIE